VAKQLAIETAEWGVVPEPPEATRLSKLFDRLKNAARARSGNGDGTPRGLLALALQRAEAERAQMRAASDRIDSDLVNSAAQALAAEREAAQREIEERTAEEAAKARTGLERNAEAAAMARAEADRRLPTRPGPARVPRMKRRPRRTIARKPSAPRSRRPGGAWTKSVAPPRPPSARWRRSRRRRRARARRPGANALEISTQEARESARSGKREPRRGAYRKRLARFAAAALIALGAVVFAILRCNTSRRTPLRSSSSTARCACEKWCQVQLKKSYLTPFFVLTERVVEDDRSSRSGPVEMMAMGASTSCSRRLRYDCAFFGSLSNDLMRRWIPSSRGALRRPRSQMARTRRRPAGCRGARRDHVAHRDAHDVEPVQHVELVMQMPERPFDLHRALQRRGVEPTAAPRPPGDRSVLVALHAQVLAHLVVELGRERPAPTRVAYALATPST